MYAVIRTGGKQYRVATGDVVKIEKVGGEANSPVEFNNVLAFTDGDSPIAKPSTGKVLGTIVSEGRGDKVLVFHFKRKKQYKKLRGHRQSYTAVRITEIAFDGQSFKAPELAKKQPKPKKAAAHEEGHEPEVRAAKAHSKKKAAPKKSAAKKAGPKKK